MVVATMTLLIVQIEAERKGTATLNLAQPALIGRSDGDDTGGDLALDLAAFGGDKIGVSRRHAYLSSQEGVVFIEDLGSTNGTRINGLRIASEKLYRLRDGDEIEMGSARLIVRVAR